MPDVLHRIKAMLNGKTVQSTPDATMQAEEPDDYPLSVAARQAAQDETHARPWDAQ